MLGLFFCAVQVSFCSAYCSGAFGMATDAALVVGCAQRVVVFAGYCVIVWAAASFAVTSTPTASRTRHVGDSAPCNDCNGQVLVTTAAAAWPLGVPT